MTRLALVPALVALTALPACVSSAPAHGVDPAAPTAAAAPSGGVYTVGTMAAGPTLSVEDAIARADALDGQAVRVAGTIRQVCQVRGCWLTFATDAGQTLRIVTHGEDEGEREDLTFPMDSAGRQAEVAGTLRVTQESVERRRHLAEDAGASPDEIAAITQPSRAVALVATGARIEPAR